VPLIEAVATDGVRHFKRNNIYFILKVVSLCFEVCYPQRKALFLNKSKAKTGKNRHVSQDIRHLHDIPRGKGLWDTIHSSSGRE